MKNAEKIMTGLQKAFTGHRVGMLYRPSQNVYFIFIDGDYVGRFVAEFFEDDIDNPEIEIKVKAPLKNIRDFVDHANSYGIIRAAVERGLKEWREESQANN